MKFSCQSRSQGIAEIRVHYIKKKIPGHNIALVPLHSDYDSLVGPDGLG
jgi:hypothetical protein